MHRNAAILGALLLVCQMVLACASAPPPPPATAAAPPISAPVGTPVIPPTATIVPPTPTLAAVAPTPTAVQATVAPATPTTAAYPAGQSAATASAPTPGPAAYPAPSTPNPAGYPAPPTPSTAPYPSPPTATPAAKPAALTPNDIGATAIAAAQGEQCVATAPMPAKGFIGDPVRGKTLFADRGCSACHGDLAQGLVGPKLAGTTLSFGAVIQQLRQPRGVMQRYLPSAQSDADECDVYQYVKNLKP